MKIQNLVTLFVFFSFTTLALAQALGSLPINRQLMPHQSPAIGYSVPTEKVTDERDSKDSKQPAGNIEAKIEPFGSFLFQGRFAHQSFTGFNPDYQINIGDQITVRLWGAVDFNESLTVDPQGNIFIAGVGPVPVVNVKNSSLQDVIRRHVQRVFQRNVHTYTSLTTNQEVKVYVTGFVRNPGLYAGLNTDSILYYLDKANGIDLQRGSFLDVKILRNNNIIYNVDLYAFVMEGRMPVIQFQDGDTILVTNKKPTVQAIGLVQNPSEFEIRGELVPLSQILQYARPTNEATHIRLLRNEGTTQSFAYFPIQEAANYQLRQGDVVEVISDKTVKNITIRIEGEHGGQKELIFPMGTQLRDVMSYVKFTSLSDKENIQLYRQSVKQVQKERLQQSLSMLERSTLSASPASREEADLRAKEADMIMKLIERARTLEPTGQVVLSRSEDRLEMVMESGDVLHIPQKSQVIMVHGEVLFPNAIAYEKRYSVKDYVRRAGGFTQRANEDHIVVLHRDGSFSVQESGWFSSRVKIQPGDEIFIIPKIDTKTLQLTKDIAQILYQIAVTTKVVLSI